MDTPESLAGHVIVAGYPEGEPPARIIDALGADGLGGVILFKRNLRLPPLAIARHIDALIRACPGPPPIVAVDQEGGRVARLGPPVITLPPMRVLGTIDRAELTRRAASVLGGQLRALGFNVDFAPVLDVDTNPENPVIGDRSFGSDPELVARHGIAFAEGLQAAAIAACAKHFPGHGDTDTDSHLELPALRHDRARLDAVELAPFRAAAKRIDSVMTAHIVFSDVDETAPATLSSEVLTGILRNELGYDGIVFSDDLEMRAVADHDSTGSCAVRAIRAGCDIVLVCKSTDRVFEAREALAREARAHPSFEVRLRHCATRVRAFRLRYPAEPIVDPDALDAALTDPEVQRVEQEIAALR